MPDNLWSRCLVLAEDDEEPTPTPEPLVDGYVVMALDGQTNTLNPNNGLLRSLATPGLLQTAGTDGRNWLLVTDIPGSSLYYSPDNLATFQSILPQTFRRAINCIGVFGGVWYLGGGGNLSLPSGAGSLFSTRTPLVLSSWQLLWPLVVGDINTQYHQYSAYSITENTGGVICVVMCDSYVDITDDRNSYTQPFSLQSPGWTRIDMLGSDTPTAVFANQNTFAVAMANSPSQVLDGAVWRRETQLLSNAIAYNVAIDGNNSVYVMAALQAGLYYSEDGLAWTPCDVDGAALTFVSVARVHFRFVALAVGDADVRSFTSDDGRSFKLLAVYPGTLQAQQRRTLFSSTGRGTTVDRGFASPTT